MPLIPIWLVWVTVFGSGAAVGGSLTWAAMSTTEKLTMAAAIGGGAYFFLKSKGGA